MRVLLLLPGSFRRLSATIISSRQRSVSFVRPAVLPKRLLLLQQRHHLFRQGLDEEQHQRRHLEERDQDRDFRRDHLRWYSNVSNQNISIYEVVESFLMEARAISEVCIGPPYSRVCFQILLLAWVNVTEKTDRGYLFLSCSESNWVWLHKQEATHD